MKQIVKILIPVMFSILLYGCVQSPYYQKEYSVSGKGWEYGFAPSFKFDITDTTVPYKMQFLIRHTEAYPFGNIWLIANIKKPGDTVFEKIRMEIPLAEPTGKWLGRGMGEVWEQRMPLSFQDNDSLFTTPGTWEVQLEQNMRMNPLPEVLQIGLRVEKQLKP